MSYSQLIKATPLIKSAYNHIDGSKPDIIKQVTWGTEELKSLLPYLFTEKPSRKMEARMHLTNLLDNKSLINTEHISKITIQILQYYQITNTELIDFCVDQDLFRELYGKGRCFCELSRQYALSSVTGYGYDNGTFSFHKECCFVTWLASTYNMKLEKDTKIKISK
ncbi:unnamed protein product [Meganyctiphanes norvegica]|uniref:Uncharacterized protein n=1 Tax=Meganyctiphanes norvegica TaxID=48144 RepID=A0AAV2QIZ4_MEGNR